MQDFHPATLLVIAQENAEAFLLWLGHRRSL